MSTSLVVMSNLLGNPLHHHQVHSLNSLNSGNETVNKRDVMLALTEIMFWTRSQTINTKQ